MNGIFVKQTLLPLLLSDSGLELPPLTWGEGEDLTSFCVKGKGSESHFDFWAP